MSLESGSPLHARRKPIERRCDGAKSMPLITAFLIGGIWIICCYTHQNQTQTQENQRTKRDANASVIIDVASNAFDLTYTHTYTF